MKKKILINGFGRMGRLFLRASWNREEFEIVQINESQGDAISAAHLLEFDSIHGRWDKDISVKKNSILIDGKAVFISHFAEPAEISSENIDIIVECTGQFKEKKSLQVYFDKGISKVLVSAPVKDPEVLNVVYGVNDHLYDSSKHHLVTAASCTTNCLAPVVKVLQETIGIKHGLITTIHNITNTQTLIDSPHKDLRRARACSQSLIPTTTGSATAITLIYPELEGKLNGLAVRVPLLNSSLIDCVFEVKKTTHVEEINGFFQEASETYLKGILGYEERPLVSIDFKDDIRSSIIDGLSTMVNNGTQVKILAWYDNEIGYVNRMSEFCAEIAKKL